MVDNFFKKMENVFNDLENTIDKSFDTSFNCTLDSSSIVINGKEYKGKNIQINNGEIIIDGKKQNNEKSKNYTFIVNGNIKNVNCISVTINGNVTGDIDCTSCTINGDVVGDIDGTSVKVNGKHKGFIK